MLRLDDITQKIKPMSSLPNQKGFEFIGVKFDGTTIDCFVKFSFEGQYIVLRKSNNNRVFQELSGWLHK